MAAAQGVWGVAIRAVEEEEVRTILLVVRFQSNPAWTMGGGGAAQRQWDCMADNIKLGKKEEETPSEVALSPLLP
jgi:hypothetical protein